MVAFGLGNANSRDHGGDENVRIADYYTHIELVEELIRSYEQRYYQVRSDRCDFHQKKRTITAVKDVTIHIQEGDIYGIVGYSGAGKSTLVRVINLLQKPSAGKITIDDDVIFDDNGDV